MKDTLSVIPEFFFDVVGVFIPGFALLAAFLWMDLLPLPDQSYEAYHLAVAVLASYLVGHLVFSFSQRYVAWLADKIGVKPKDTWLASENPLSKNLLARVEAKWSIPGDASAKSNLRTMQKLCTHT